MTTPTVQRAPDAAFRKKRGRIIATLIRHAGNYDLSEECAQGRCHEPCVCRHLSLTVVTR
jgi:predicted RNA polymerase sigma factor